MMDTVALTTWSMAEAQLAYASLPHFRKPEQTVDGETPSIIAACIPTLKRLFESILRNLGLLSSQSGTQYRSGYLRHEEPTRRGYNTEAHNMSGMRSQRDHKSSTATTNAETDSLESGEMPIMNHKASVGEFEADNSSAPGSYFRTAIKGGDKSLAGGRGGGIQMETTVSVRTEPKPKRRDGDIV